jgi:hypothetical protein
MRNDEPRPVWMSLLITIERRAIVCVKEKKCNTLLFWKNSEAFFSVCQPSVKPVQEDLNPKRLTENYSPICPSKFRLKISGIPRFSGVTKKREFINFTRSLCSNGDPALQKRTKRERKNGAMIAVRRRLLRPLPPRRAAAAE